MVKDEAGVVVVQLDFGGKRSGTDEGRGRCNGSTACPWCKRSGTWQRTRVMFGSTAGPWWRTVWK